MNVKFLKDCVTGIGTFFKDQIHRIEDSHILDNWIEVGLVEPVREEIKQAIQAITEPEQVEPVTVPEPVQPEPVAEPVQEPETVQEPVAEPVQEPVQETKEVAETNAN